MLINNIWRCPIFKTIGWIGANSIRAANYKNTPSVIGVNTTNWGWEFLAVWYDRIDMVKFPTGVNFRRINEYDEMPKEKMER